MRRTAPVGRRAKVVGMPEGRYLSVELAPETTDDGWDWRDSLAMVRGLVEDKPLPGPRKPDAGGTSKVADPVEEEEEEDNFSFLTSPWFWGGLGVVVTAGVTVLVLSETVFQEHDTVVVEGRITP